MELQTSRRSNLQSESDPYLSLAFEEHFHSDYASWFADFCEKLWIDPVELRRASSNRILQGRDGRFAMLGNLDAWPGRLMLCLMLAGCAGARLSGQEPASSVPPSAKKPSAPQSPVSIVCDVEGKTIVLELILNSTRVKKGDVLCELDSAPLREKLDNQGITTEKAKQQVAEAENDLKVASVALSNYTEGDLVAEELAVGRALTAALDAESRAQKQFDSLSKKLSPQEYPVRNAKQTLLQTQVVRGQIEAEQAALTTRKTARRRTLELAVEKAETSVKSLQATYTLEQAKFYKLRTQVAKCTIKAPCAGLVMIAGPSSPNSPPVMEGEPVRQRQLLMQILPDPVAPTTSH